jgi:hypothetical protein
MEVGVGVGVGNAEKEVDLAYVELLAVVPASLGAIREKQVAVHPPISNTKTANRMISRTLLFLLTCR